MATGGASDICIHSGFIEEDAKTVKSFDLPAEVLCRVMQHVAQKQRIGTCAQVCHAWQAAARAATTAIHIEWWHPRVYSGEKRGALTRWLLADASQLTSIKARGVFRGWLQPTELQLPFHNLQQLKSLHLEWFTVTQAVERPNTAPAGHSNLSVNNTGNHLGDLVKLTCLRLDSSTIKMEDGLNPLSNLTNLRHLHLFYVEPQSEASVALNAALACLSKLTHLTVEFDNKYDKESGVEMLMKQGDLKELDLAYCRLSLGGLWTLPNSLSSLRFCEVEVPVRPGQDAVLQHLTSKLRGEIAEWPWSWSLLLLTDLRRLVLENMVVDGLACQVVAEKLSNLHYLCLQGSSCAHEENTPELLAGLRYLTNLEHLNLRGTLCYIVQPVAAYSALTSSSKLTYLDLGNCTLPHGVISAMFSLLRRLPDLHVLIFDKVDHYKHVSDSYEAQNNEASASGVESLVLCCPGLQELHMCEALQEGEQLTSLGTLQQLHTLAIGGAAVDNDLVVASVPYLASVANLGIAKSPGFTTHGLVTLTQLTQLIKLEVVNCGVLDGLQESVRYIESKENPPDVWKKLEQECMKHDVSRELLLARSLKDATL